MEMMEVGESVDLNHYPVVAPGEGREGRKGVGRGHWITEGRDEFIQMFQKREGGER